MSKWQGWTVYAIQSVASGAVWGVLAEWKKVRHLFADTLQLWPVHLGHVGGGLHSSTTCSTNVTVVIWQDPSKCVECNTPMSRSYFLNVWLTMSCDSFIQFYVTDIRLGDSKFLGLQFTHRSPFFCWSVSWLCWLCSTVLITMTGVCFDSTFISLFACRFDDFVPLLSSCLVCEWHTYCFSASDSPRDIRHFIKFLLYCMLLCVIFNRMCDRAVCQHCWLPVCIVA